MMPTWPVRSINGAMSVPMCWCVCVCGRVGDSVLVFPRESTCVCLLSTALADPVDLPCRLKRSSLQAKTIFPAG